MGVDDLEESYQDFGGIRQMRTPPDGYGDPPEGYVECTECDGKGYVKCEHEDREDGVCLMCGYDFRPELIDEAKDKHE